MRQWVFAAPLNPGRQFDLRDFMFSPGMLAAEGKSCRPIAGKLMERERTYDDLTSRQRWALQALEVELNSYPIAEAMLESIRLRGIDASTDAGKAEYRRALGGARAAQLLFSHHQALHDASERRKAIGRAGSGSV